MAREPTNAPLHLRPHAPVAERALLPGDPGRALRLAQDLTDGPRMVNHHRGLWGYTGTAADGAPLTVQSTGLGGPSAAAVVGDLVALGARRVVRAGTCVALDDELELGELLVVERALARDGASRALGAGDVIEPDGAPHAGLRRAVVLSVDVAEQARAAGSRDAHAWDMTSAAVLAAAARHGAAAGALLLVVEDVRGRRLEGEALHAAELELGRAALAGLT